MLRHAKLTTTQIYTHVSVRMLKQIHSATHPGARLNNEKPLPTPQEEPGRGDPTTADLLAALAEEAEEEN
jgi:integrase/recombinase XerD